MTRPPQAPSHITFGPHALDASVRCAQEHVLARSPAALAIFAAFSRRRSGRFPSHRSYFDQLKLNGELDALRWLKNKHAQP